jgi:adenine-specific DNA-methyltransferase
MTTAVRYMGSKKVLAPRIARLIGRHHPDATVLDAFAGMCAIGTELAPAHRVIANDVHAFAEIAGKALLTAPRRRLSEESIRSEIEPAYEENLAMLRPVLEDRLVQEWNALAAVSDGRWREYRRFAVDDVGDGKPVSFANSADLSSYRAQPRQTPFALFSMYYASAYFGVRQALEIDCLRYAVESAPQERRDLYLYGLLCAASHSAATSGHFAQYLVPRDEANTRYIARIRRRSVVERFFASLREIKLPRCLDRRGNRTHRREATALLKDLRGGMPNLVIYADPPYSRAQYSRYYHVLETLVLYDYPESTGKGRYRGDRFETERPTSHAKLKSRKRWTNSWARPRRPVRRYI